MDDNIRNCFDYFNKVLLVSNVINIEIKIDKEDALKIDSYIIYDDNKYSNDKSYTKYIIKERILDNHGNLILICDEKRFN